MRRSFTLVEVLICTTIIIIILGVIFYVLNTGRDSFYIISEKMELLHKVRNALEFMEGELLQSRRSLLSIPADGNYYNSVTFRIPDNITENGTIVWSEEITYSLNSNNQLVRTQAGEEQIIASYVNELKFRIDNTLPNLLEIYITAEKETFLEREISFSLESKIKMRN